MSIEAGISFICLLAAGLGLVLSVGLFFHRQGNIAANRLVASLVLLYSLRLAEFSAYWTPFFLAAPHLLFLTSAFQFLFGPLLYLYARTILRRGSRLQWFDPLHALPFVIHVAYLLPFYFLPGHVKREVFDQIALRLDATVGTGFLVTEFLQIVHLAVYSLIAFFLVTRATIGRKPAALARTSWLRKMLAVFGIFIVIDLVHYIELAFFGHIYIVWADLGVIFLQALTVTTIGYEELRHPEIHEKVSALTDGTGHPHSTLTGEQVKDYLYRLTRAMEVDRRYRNSELSLPVLAEHLNIPVDHLTQVLDEHLQEDFADYVDGYRVDEAKQVLTSDDMSVEATLVVALGVGFQDLPSFESAFKKHTGMTPDEFRLGSEGL
jgi:AraC-like DNA-binding protein